MKAIGAMLMALLVIVFLIALLYFMYEVTPACSRAGNMQSAGDVIDCMATRTAEARNK